MTPAGPSVLDTTALATFLEAYPFPALAISLPPSRPSPLLTPVLDSPPWAAPEAPGASVDLTRSGVSSPTPGLGISGAAPSCSAGASVGRLPPSSPPLAPMWSVPAPLWSNSRWRRAARRRPLADCLSPSDACALVQWLLGRARAVPGGGGGGGCGCCANTHCRRRHGHQRLDGDGGADANRTPTEEASAPVWGLGNDTDCGDGCPSSNAGFDDGCPSSNAACDDGCPSSNADCDDHCPSSNAGCDDGCPSSHRPESASEDEFGLLPRSPDIDLSTREGVKRWAANVGAPVRPHPSDPTLAHDDPQRPLHARRTTIRAHPRKPQRPRTRGRSHSQTRLHPDPTTPVITLDFQFPTRRSPRTFQLTSTVLATDCAAPDVTEPSQAVVAIMVITFVPVRTRRRDSTSPVCCQQPSYVPSDASDVEGTIEDHTAPVDEISPMASPRGRPPGGQSIASAVDVQDGLRRMSLTGGAATSLGRSPTASIDIRRSSHSTSSEHVHGEISAKLLPAHFVAGDSATIGGEFTPGQPIFINGDGTIKAAPAGAAPFPSGDPLSVAHLLQNYDWSKTPLGPLDTWPVSLRSIVSMMSLFPLGTAVFWGKELTFLYNQAYSQFIPNHPQLFGVHGAEGMQHLQSSLGSLTPALLAGSSIYKDDEFYMRRAPDGSMRESYRSLLWAPIKNEKGHYGGIWHATRDTTPKVLADRRLSLIRDLSGRTSTCRTIHEWERGILETLHLHPKDAPFALMYFVDELGATRPNEMYDPRLVRMRLAGSIGVPTDHPSAPDLIAVHLAPEMVEERPSSQSTFPSEAGYAHDTNSPVPSYSSTAESIIGSQDPGWQFADVLTSRDTLVVECKDLIDDYPVRAWDALPDEAVVIPVSLKSEDGLPGAVLVLGLSPRLDYDTGYTTFIDDFRFIVASYLSAVRSYDADQRRLGDLATLDRAKSLLFSSVSHELLAPLTLIAGPLDDVIMDLRDTCKRESLVMARRNVSRLSRLVDMLVDISNLEAGRLRGSFAKINLGVVTRDVAGQFRKAAAKAQLQYTIHCDEKPRNVFVDRERWEKILFSLIENALKYTTEGYVKVSLEYTHRQAVLTVADTGVGISSSCVEDLNDGFHRRAAEPTLTSTKSGLTSGISLTFAKKLVQLHHGEFEIESKTAHESADGSHGTIFRVRIPLGSSHLPPEALATTNAHILSMTASSAQFGREMIDEVYMWHTDRDREETESTTATVSSGETKRGPAGDGNMLNFTPKDVVMVVEDMPDAQRYLRSIFEPLCQVVVAQNGLDALQKYDSQPPDAIISDVLLPGMNGMELLDALRAGTREQRLVPFILLAAADEVRTSSMLRADDYISKPFNARELVVRTNMQLQMGKERRMLEQLFEERTQELRLLSDHSPAGILRCDESGRLVYANLAWRRMSGVPAGQPLMVPDHVHPESNKENILATWKQFLESDETVINMQVRWANGRWISFKLARLDNALPGKGGFIGSAIDITEAQLNEDLQKQRIAEAEKRRAEAEEARQQQELLIDITSHEIRNPISSILQISSLLTAFANRNCSSMVRSSLLALQEQLQRVVEAGEANPTAAAAATDHPGSFQPTRQLLMSVADDLDALDSIYQCGLAQERISNDVLSLGKMQLDLLHMFDVETSIPTVARNLLSIFQNEARMNRINLNLSISDKFEKLGLLTVMTDPVRLSQIVTNLISNAIRFTANSRERRIELNVDVSLLPPSDGTCLVPPPASEAPQLVPGSAVYVYMSVIDTGPGLTPGELEKLFQRFAQASPMTHTVFGGSGLGLFVCRKLAERMGGRIEVTSEYGKGSQFRFFIRTTWPGKKMLPLLAAKSPLMRSASSPLPKHVQQPGLDDKMGVGSPNVALPPTRKLHVLVVEDNLINRTVLLRQLKHVGIEADSAKNGLEALRKVEAAMGLRSEAEAYDCILMDLEMPVMDGYTAARKIREEEAEGLLGKSVIIALTGNARQAQIREGMADFDVAVIKPYRLDDLLRKMEEHVGKQAELRDKAGTR